MKYICCYLLFFLLGSATARSADSTQIDYQVNVSKIIMGTAVEATARYSDINYCKKALYYAYREMERVENLLAWQKENSEIAQINRAAGIQAVSVSAETFAILQRAAGYARKLDGLFDVTIGPLSSLWGFSGPEGGHLPQENEIKQQLALVNYRNLVLNTKDSTVFLARKGMRLDLGGIAKGYAIDRGSMILKEKGVTNFIINGGGDIYVSGQKDDHTPWMVGIKDPRDGQNLVVRFALKDYAVATSGDYERFIMVNGQRYHHILDPRDGYPGKLSQSSSTFASTVEEADVLATYLFIIGSRQAEQKKVSNPFLIIDSQGQLSSNGAFDNLAGLQY